MKKLNVRIYGKESSQKSSLNSPALQHQRDEKTSEKLSPPSTRTPNDPLQTPLKPNSKNRTLRSNSKQYRLLLQKTQTIHNSPSLFLKSSFRRVRHGKNQFSRGLSEYVCDKIRTEKPLSSRSACSKNP